MRFARFFFILLFAWSTIFAARVIPFPELLSPELIRVDENKIYITEKANIYIYSKKDFKLVKKFGKKGAGPEEFKIGFANLGDSMPFAMDVRRGLEQAAQEASNVDLIVADNQLDGRVACQVADRLIAKGVDLAIEYQIDEKVGSLIIDKFKRAGIPVIAVDIPMVGATYFGVDHYRAGHMAGVALGNWIAEHWNNSWERLIVLEEQRPGALVAARIQGQLDGLQQIVGNIPSAKIVYLDSGSIVPNGVLWLVQRNVEIAQVVVSIGKFRLCLDCLTVGLLGPVEIQLPMIDLRQLELSQCKIGRNLRGRLVGRHGHAELSQLGVNHSQVEIGFHQIRMLSNGFFVSTDGLFEPALFL